MQTNLEKARKNGLKILHEFKPLLEILMPAKGLEMGRNALDSLVALAGKLVLKATPLCSRRAMPKLVLFYHPWVLFSVPFCMKITPKGDFKKSNANSGMVHLGHARVLLPTPVFFRCLNRLPRSIFCDHQIFDK